MKLLLVILLLMSCTSTPPPQQIVLPSLLTQPIEVPKKEFTESSTQEDVGLYIVQLIQTINEANIQIDSINQYLEKWNKIQEKK